MGRWLRVYHASTLREENDVVDLAVAIIQGAMGRMRAACPRGRHILSAALQERLHGQLDRAAQRVQSWGPMDVAQLHGDFELANILVDRQGGLWVADFADTHRGLAMEDFVRIWHSVWAVAQTSARRRRVLVPCLEALAASYGVSDGVLQSPPSVLLRCWNAMAIVLSAAMAPWQFGRSGNRALRRLATVNVRWLESADLW